MEASRVLAVGVFPPEEFQRLTRLLGALESVFPVTFEPRQAGAWDGLDAALLLQQQTSEAAGDQAVRATVPYFSWEYASRDRSGAEPLRVEFTSSSRLDSRLRGRSCVELDATLPSDSRFPSGDETLAHVNGRTVWWTREQGAIRSHHTAFAATELQETGALWDHFRSGRFMTLVPLVQFLREITGYSEWGRPGLRASFLFDDPNLHRPSYGHLRFAEVAAQARSHGYHVGFATVPLDGWFVHRRTAGLFRANSDVLSLATHGNDHVYRELAPHGSADELGIAAQARRRTDAFEAKTGVRVAPMMVPPHGQYSATMLDALRRCGYEGLCGDFPPPWWTDVSRHERGLRGWHMAEITPSGLPVMTRYSLAHPRADDEFLFWSLLDRPIILYGHHGDVAEGLNVLDREAAAVNDLGDASWMSLESIARSNFMTRRENDVLRIRLFSRTVDLLIPEDVTGVIAELPVSYDGIDAETAVLVAPNGSHAASGPLSSLIPVGGGQTVRLQLTPSDAVDVATVPDPPRHISAIARRVAAETKDRLRPAVGRAGLEPLMRRFEQNLDAVQARRHNQ